MKFMTPFLMAVPPAVSVAQSKLGEAQAPSREQLMDHDYIAVGPLMPLMAVVGAGAQR